jgi:hypothetical protein
VLSIRSGRAKEGHPAGPAGSVQLCAAGDILTD